MNKRDFITQKHNLEDIAKKAREDRKELIYKFQNECPHSARDIRVTQNNYEDEYGKRQMSWRDFTAVCTRCDVAMNSNFPYRNAQEWRQALAERAKVKW